MTSHIFTEWVNGINNQIKADNRFIALLLDNAPCHPRLDLSNVKLVFLPKNTTGVLQPLDLGIIQATKINARKRLLRHLLKLIESAPSVVELTKKIHILDAINWINSSCWENVSAETIRKCFFKAGINVLAPERWARDEPLPDFEEELQQLPAEIREEFCELFVCCWKC